MTVGDRIKSARESAGITQSELGKVCGTTKQTIYKYENNVITNIPLDKLNKIAEELNTTPAYLMGWENTVGETDMILAAIDTKEDARAISDETLMFGLWGDSDDVNEDDLADVKRYAEFIRERKKGIKGNDGDC